MMGEPRLINSLQNILQTLVHTLNNDVGTAFQGIDEAPLTREHLPQHLANHIKRWPMAVAHITPKPPDQPLHNGGLDVHNKRDRHSLQKQLRSVGAFNKNQVVRLVQRPGANLSGAHVITAQGIKLSIANSAHLQSKLISINRINRVEPIARDGGPPTAVVVIAGDQKWMTPSSSQLFRKMCSKGCLTGRRRTANANQRNRSGQAPTQFRPMLTTGP